MRYQQPNSGQIFVSMPARKHKLCSVRHRKGREKWCTRVQTHRTKSQQHILTATTSCRTHPNEHDQSITTTNPHELFAHPLDSASWRFLLFLPPPPPLLRLLQNTDTCCDFESLGWLHVLVCRYGNASAFFRVGEPTATREWLTLMSFSPFKKKTVVGGLELIVDVACTVACYPS